MNDIPDEAYRAMVDGMNTYGHNDEGMYAAGLVAAAPHIARAAQVAILREMADELNAAGNKYPAWQAKGWHYASDYTANKADELEAGCGIEAKEEDWR